jgi:GNAT superfamily N-acetyltransferase
MENTSLYFRSYQPADYQQIKKIMQAAYADLETSYATEEEMNLLHSIYPEGQILCFHDDKLIALSINRIVATDKYVANFTEKQASDLSIYALDAEVVESVYAIDFMVLPEYQNQQIGKKLRLFLHHQIFEIDNFRALVGVSRINNYYNYQQVMNCETYIQKVKNREIIDPVLSFHLVHKMQIREILPNFNLEDLHSCGYGVSVILNNPNYNPNLPVYPNRYMGA